MGLKIMFKRKRKEERGGIIRKKRKFERGKEREFLKDKFFS